MAVFIGIGIDLVVVIIGSQGLNGHGGNVHIRAGAVAAKHPATVLVAADSVGQLHLKNLGNETLAGVFCILRHLICAGIHGDQAPDPAINPLRARPLLQRAMVASVRDQVDVASVVGAKMQRISLQSSNGHHRAVPFGCLCAVENTVVILVGLLNIRTHGLQVFLVAVPVVVQRIVVTVERVEVTESAHSEGHPIGGGGARAGHIALIAEQRFGRDEARVGLSAFDGAFDVSRQLLRQLGALYKGRAHRRTGIDRLFPGQRCAAFPVDKSAAQLGRGNGRLFTHTGGAAVAAHPLRVGTGHEVAVVQRAAPGRPEQSANVICRAAALDCARIVAVCQMHGFCLVAASHPADRGGAGDHAGVVAVRHREGSPGLARHAADIAGGPTDGAYVIAAGDHAASVGITDHAADGRAAADRRLVAAVFDPTAVERADEPCARRALDLTLHDQILYGTAGDIAKQSPI